MNRHGQTSLEMLLIVSFTLVLGLAIGIPFLENQARTNASIQAKLAILPFIEKNSSLVRISSMTASVIGSGASKLLTMAVKTKGTVDSVVLNELTSGGCARICSQIDLSGYYTQVGFSWESDTNGIVCSFSSC